MNMDNVGATDASPAADRVPLVVDVDGTLLATDLLHEAALQFVAHRPWRAPDLLLWLRQGKSQLKAQLAAQVDPGIDHMPLRPEVMALIVAAQAEGRPVYLASASDARYVRALAGRIGGVAGVFASDGAVNLAGAAKADRLVAVFGAGGYDYVGDAAVDIPVWRAARRKLVVAGGNGFAERVRAALPDCEIVARPATAPRNYLRAMRPHQWAKNLLLFLPAIAGHRLDADTLTATALGFVCFCLAASSAYVLNDLLDLPADRAHPRKRRRPFASGELPSAHGVVLAGLAMATALALAPLLGAEFFVVLGLYVAGTLSYSMLLKRQPLIDVVMLSGLYTVRVYGGLAAGHTPPTQWLLMFCVFVFLSLALVKRCSELVLLRNSGRTALAGRGYRDEDLPVLLALAASGGYGAVLVFTLYLASPEVKLMYLHPGRLWLICPLLIYWVSRVLALSNRGELHDDPVVFALTDRISWAVAASIGLILAASV